MSDNKLLTENTIRRFMKLANVEGLTENFIEDLEERGNPPPAPAKRGKKKMEEEVEETNEEINEEEEVELEENFEDLQEEEEDDEPMEMDAELGDEMPADDAEPEMGAADMSLTEEEARLLIDLGERLSAAMGGGEEAPADDMSDMGDMDAMDAEAPEEEEEMMEEDFDQDELVNEVLKRVTKRLVAEKLKNRK